MLLRREGSVPLAQLRDEMDRLVTDFFGTPAAPARRAWRTGDFPALNVWEDGDVFYAEAEVPGLKQENLEISVVGTDLTIHGRRGGEPREGASYHRQERGTGEFNRVLRLPEEIDAAKVEATLTDGVLLIKLPKAESAKPRKIKVKTE
jgi:HSP20 family protein